MLYEVEGKISFTVSIDVEADSEEQAIALARADLEDYYHLDVLGAYHNSDKVNFDLDAYEYEEEEEEEYIKPYKEEE
jgi:hypothetical protein